MKPQVEISRVIDRATEYDVELLISYKRYNHRMGFTLEKPATKAKLDAAIAEVLANVPTGENVNLLTCRWEGMEEDADIG